MPFILDTETLLIKGRKGDSASFTFNFKESLESFCVHFYVKRNLNDSDDKVVLKKEYSNIDSNSLTVQLSPEDTKKFVVQNGSYSVYYWGLKIHNGTEFAQTIIPLGFENPPKMYIYSEIGGIN